MIEYELWLDESGDFQEEKAKKYRNKNASLVGGILIKKEDADRMVLTDLIDENRNHAMLLAESDKVDYILPILEKIRDEYNAKEVFFENKDYEEGENNRQLYLRIIAEGILQLLLRLNATNESVRLRVTIARRQDVRATGGMPSVIADREYVNELKECINHKKADRKIILNEDTSLDFTIKIADRTMELQLADFACNTRYTRQCMALSAVADRVEKLHDEEFIFSMTEESASNAIMRSLVQGNMGKAVIDVFTLSSVDDREKNLKIVFERINKSSYSTVKVQIKQVMDDISAYIALEDDFELGENFLIRILSEFIPRLADAGHNYDEFKFGMLLHLAHMYLLEGDIIAAKNTLIECESTFKNIDSRLEDVLPYLRLKKLWALYYQKSFQYEKAEALLESMINSMKKLTMSVNRNVLLREVFVGTKTENIGEAIRMLIVTKILANKDLPYKKMCKLSDTAMKQYPCNEGELVKQRQCRCIIELRNGHYENAILYLIRAEIPDTDECSKENIIRFLDSVSDTEVKISSLYYLMYYMIIMENAQKSSSKLGQIMYEALTEQGRLLGLVTKKGALDWHVNSVNLLEAQKPKRGVRYHPLEIIYLKYASYLHELGDEDSKKNARDYLRKAVDICLNYEDYLAMRITGIGMTAKLVEILLADGKNREAEENIRKISDEVIKILGEDIEDETRAFVETLKELLDAKRYDELIGCITY